MIEQNVISLNVEKEANVSKIIKLDDFIDGSLITQKSEKSNLRKLY